VGAKGDFWYPIHFPPKIALPCSIKEKNGNRPREMEQETVVTHLRAFE
jgi:hypothetical protein